MQSKIPENTTILVVALDPSFQRSLAFVLEAEGCRVDVADRLPALADPSNPHDCIVVDHKALPAAATGGTVMAGLGAPVVLLVSGAQEMAARGFARVVVKPFLGQKLVEAVREAIGTEPRQPAAT